MKNMQPIVLIFYLSSIMIVSVGCNILKPILFKEKPNNTHIPETQSNEIEKHAQESETQNPYQICVPTTSKPEKGIVTKVIDGDSIQVNISGREYEIRYIGINAPDYDWDEQEKAEAATTANTRLVLGKEVVMFRDVSDTDKYGRLLRYVFLNEIFVNDYLVENGFAESKAYPPDTACQKILMSKN